MHHRFLHFFSFCFTAKPFSPKSYEKGASLGTKLLFVFSLKGALVGALFLFCLFLCNLRFLFSNHLGEFGFALLSRFGVDVELLPFAVWQSWIEAAFPEMIVDLIDASSA